MILTEIAQKIAQDLAKFSEKAASRPSFNTDQLQTFIQSALRKCDLVSREEFDAQTAVLARTRSKLEALEKHIAELNEAIEANTSQKPASQKPFSPQKPVSP